MNKLLFLSCLLLVLSGVNAGYSDIFLSGDARPVVLDGDSGDFEWFVGDQAFLSMQKFVPSENLSDEFLLDFGSKSIIVTEHNVVPGNLTPLLKAKKDAYLPFNVLLSGDATWRFWIFEGDGRVIPVDVGSGALTVSLREGDWLVVYFNANSYGVEKAQFNSGERDFRVWVDVTQFGDWVGRLSDIPSRDDCQHFMDKELSMLYCQVEQEVCLDRYVGVDARNPSCSWDKIFSCQFDLCFEEMQRSKDADLIAEQERRMEAESKTEAGLSVRISELEKLSYIDSNRSMALESQVTSVRDDVVSTLTNYGLIIVVLFVFAVGGVGSAYWYWHSKLQENKKHRLNYGFGGSRQPFDAGLSKGKSLERTELLEEIDKRYKPKPVEVKEVKEVIEGKEPGLFDGLNEWIERQNERFGKK